MEEEEVEKSSESEETSVVELGRPLVVIVCGTLVYYHCAYRGSSLLSLLSDVLIVLLCSLAILGMLFRQMNISVPVDPLEWQISQDTANGIVECLANTLGATESVLRVAATGHDRRLFFKVVLILYLLSALGRLASGATVAYAGLCLFCLYIFAQSFQSINKFASRFSRRRDTSSGAQDVMLIENGYLGLRNGILDQSAILLSKCGHLTIMNCKTKDHTLVQSPSLYPEWQKAYKILLAFSGLKHALPDNPGYNCRVSECQEAAEVLLWIHNLEAVLNEKLKGGSGDAKLEPLLCYVDPSSYETHKVVLILYLLSALSRLASGATVAYAGLCLFFLYIFAQSFQSINKFASRFSRRRDTSSGAQDVM